PDEMLLLAFNTAAANELGERIDARLRSAGLDPEGVRAQTFHAFSLRVIGEATGRKPRLAAGREVDHGQGLVGEGVDALKGASDEYAVKWWRMQSVLGVPIGAADEPAPASYGAENRRLGFRTIDGDVVKSAGERALANWLAQCGL